MIRRLFAVLVAVAAAALIAPTAGAQDAARLIMVTHGSPADPFWATIKRGAERAAEEVGVELAYRAPESFDLERMAALVAEAVEEQPDGLIVSIPNADALALPIRSAVDAGIPVISINSGFDVAQSLGALLHVGQSEYEAGRVAGERMRDLRGNRALCLNHELGNVALDLRCKGFIDGFGGSVEVMAVDADPASAGETIAEKLAADEAIDVVLALNATVAGEPAVAAAQALGGERIVRVGSFDTTDGILSAVADGKASFAVDQQPFLQGYLPVHFLALLHRDGVVPVSNVSTGPRLIDAAEAGRRLGRPAAAGDAGGSATVEQQGG